MPHHEIKKCPRCTNAFECKVGNIIQCQCSEVKLNDKEREYIDDKYIDCLCKYCMKDMKREMHYNNLKNKINSLLGIFKSK